MPRVAVRQVPAVLLAVLAVSAAEAAAPAAVEPALSARLQLRQR
jgi:hypothetical protein